MPAQTFKLQLCLKQPSRLKKQIIRLKTGTKMGVLKDDNGIAVIVLMGSYFINAC